MVALPIRVDLCPFAVEKYLACGGDMTKKSSCPAEAQRAQRRPGLDRLPGWLPKFGAEAGVSPLFSAISASLRENPPVWRLEGRSSSIQVDPSESYSIWVPTTMKSRVIQGNPGWEILDPQINSDGRLMNGSRCWFGDRVGCRSGWSRSLFASICVHRKSRFPIGIRG